LAAPSVRSPVCWAPTSWPCGSLTTCSSTRRSQRRLAVPRTATLGFASRSSASLRAWSISRCAPTMPHWCATFTSPTSSRCRTGWARRRATT